MSEERKQSLRFILSEAITELCRREAFYIAELRIEGTICVVSDRSSALIIHLTEQVGDKCSPQLDSCESKDAHDAIFTVVEDNVKDVVTYNRDVFDKAQMEEMSIKAGLVERSEGKYNCPFCPKRYRFKHSLKDHINKHTGNRPHECKHCSVRFIHLSSLCAHVRRRHSQVRVADFRCSICNDVFSTEQFLKQHHTWKHKGERKKNNTTLSSPWAESKLPSFQFPFNNSILNYNINNDMNNNNNNIGIHNNSNNNIGIHNNSNNNVDSHNNIDNANTFSINNNLNNNNNNNNLNNNNNNLNNNNNNNNNLNNNNNDFEPVNIINIKGDDDNVSDVGATNNNNNLINDDDAASYEGSKEQLLGYQQIKLEPGGTLMTPPNYFQPFHDPFTPFPPNSWPLPYSDNSSLQRACNGKFQCPHCDKSYNFKHTLKEHLNKHLGRRPNICKHCGDSFIHLASLCAHIKRVHDEHMPRDFICGICGEKLMNFQSLKQHYTWRHREAKMLLESNNLPINPPIHPITNSPINPIHSSPIPNLPITNHPDYLDQQTCSKTKPPSKDLDFLLEPFNHFNQHKHDK